MAQDCVGSVQGVEELLADKGYGADAFRSFLEEQKMRPLIHADSNRKKKIRRDNKAYKNRNTIEPCFGRLEDFRRAAARYDKLADNFLSTVCLAAIVAYWI